MKNLGKAVIAVVALAGTLSACFSDPTSDLRDGPARLSLSNRFVIQDVGDSDQINIQVFDEQGNSLPFSDPTFTSLDPAVATIIPLPDSTLRTVPGGTLYKSVLAALSEGTTKVAVTANGVTDTVTVIVLPSTASNATVGASATFGPATEITIAAPPLTTFNTTGTVSTVLFGGVAGTVIARTPTSITAISPLDFNGRVTVKDLTSQNLPVDSVLTPIATVNRAAFTGTITVNASAFGPGTQMTLLAPTGATFNAAAGAAGSQVTFGATTATVLSRTTTQIDVIATAAYTGPVTVSGMTLTAGAVALPALTTLGNQTIAPAFFPGTFSTAGDLLSTITVNSGASASFTAASSVLRLGTDTAFILTRSATTITAVAKLAYTGPISVTNVVVGGVTIPVLSSQTNITVSTTTGESNEPGNNASATATALTIGAAAGDSVVVIGAVNGTAADQSDYYTWTQPATGTINVLLAFQGNGGGADDRNPDMDVVVCTAATLSGTGSCSYGQDIIPGNAASNVVQPETGTTPSVAAGTVMFARVISFWGSSAGLGTYRLRIRRN